MAETSQLRNDLFLRLLIKLHHGLPFTDPAPDPARSKNDLDEGELPDHF